MHDESPQRAQIEQLHAADIANQVPRLSSCMQQILPIAQVTDLRRENQSVNAWKQNGHPAQTARKGKAGARAG